MSSMRQLANVVDLQNISQPLLSICRTSASHCGRLVEHQLAPVVDEGNYLTNDRHRVYIPL